MKKIFFCKKIYHDVVIHVPNFQLFAKSSSFFCAFFLHFQGVLFCGHPIIMKDRSHFLNSSLLHQNHLREHSEGNVFRPHLDSTHGHELHGRSPLKINIKRRNRFYSLLRISSRVPNHPLILLFFLVIGTIFLTLASMSILFSLFSLYLSHFLVSFISSSFLFSFYSFRWLFLRFFFFFFISLCFSYLLWPLEPI